jgi:hypothetical protein
VERSIAFQEFGAPAAVHQPDIQHLPEQMEFSLSQPHFQSASHAAAQIGETA